MPDPAIELAWPTELFEWVARRVLTVKSATFARVEGLLRQALVQEDDVEDFLEECRDSVLVWGASTELLDERAREWLERHLQAGRFRRFTAPTYFAARVGLAEVREVVPAMPFASDVRAVLDELIELSYFERVVPRPCPDGDEVDPRQIQDRISRAIQTPARWPLDVTEFPRLSDDVVLSMIEFFHDYARRPQTMYFHEYGRCGWHGQNFDTESGQAVYRWKMNDVLAAHGSPYRLASSGENRGRLVEHYADGAQRLVESERAARAAASPLDPVVHAVDVFTARGSTRTQKKSALRDLAYAIEALRPQIKVELFSADEGALFEIANRFDIRHNTEAQRRDYGDASLEWVFFLQLATLRLFRVLATTDENGPASA